MKFGESWVADERFDDSLHIRTTESPTLYAVFDDIEQVSEVFSLRDYGKAISFAYGYQEALRRYDDIA